MRVALITGAAEATSNAVAQRLAIAGHTIVLADAVLEHAQLCADKMNGAGHSAVALALDVSDEADVKRVCAWLQHRFGRLDMLVNNAALASVGDPLESLSLVAWERAIATLLTGAFLTSRSAIPLMRQNRWGRIVNICSTAARGDPGVNQAEYTAALVGVIGFSRVLADEVGGDGITVNCVAPGSAGLAPLQEIPYPDARRPKFGGGRAVVGREGVPDDVGFTVDWLCSDRAGFVTGTVVDINGGASMS